MKQYNLILFFSVLITNLSCVKRNNYLIDKEILYGSWSAEFELQKSDMSFWLVIPPRDSCHRDMIITLDTKRNVARLRGFESCEELTNVPFRISGNDVIFSNSSEIKPAMVSYYGEGDFLKYEFLEVSYHDAIVRIWKKIHSRYELFMTARLVKNHKKGVDNLLIDTEK